MNNNKYEYSESYLALMMAVCIAIGMFVGWVGRGTSFQETEVIKYVEVQGEQMFDTSVIEQAWCGDFTDGAIRMVGAWYYTDGVVEDEQGQLWGIDVPVSNEDFLLLWIADNNTPNNTVDDVIIKVWKEAH